MAHVPGRAELVHTVRRSEEFVRRCTELDIEICPVHATDYTEAAGRAATADLLSLDRQPTGIIYDNEVLTMGGLAALAAAGVRGSIAIASFEDSPLCRIVQPSVTAFTRDPLVMGAEATELLLEAIGGAAPRQILEPTMELVVRESTVGWRPEDDS
ncbi:MAG TPA: substrate-binding domain-containing protein [Tessaracoccus flavescens]|uniref:Substrate-binding domain-containing protein n=1 Tax=Tessaracoccus flavescens TaxID=399497 RepID=A0A921ERL5_9ACTN|nr:substrate-binding domain-containing protein [Tessaracoccus flavescens]